MSTVERETTDTPRHAGPNAVTDTAADPAGSTREPRSLDSAVEFVIPVYNEELVLAESVRRLHHYLTTRLPYPCRIVIADNASTDGTWHIAEELAAELPGVRALHLDEKGRGRALKAAWGSSSAAVVGYMDVDLSTDLRAIPPLVAPLLSGHSDLAIGTRLARGARVVRGPKREVISRCYNLLLRGVLSASFSDAQCGFKAVRRDVAERLLPLVEDDAWFFDTELLVLAEEAGLRIHEVPVDWVDDPDSRVDIVSTALDDLRGVRRLLTGLASGRIAVEGLVRRRTADPALPAQVVSFAAIGVFSTLAYLVLYLGLRAAVGAQAANLVALLATAVANTAANRRLTFGVRSRRGVVRHHVAGLAAFGVGLALTSGSLGLLHAASPAPSRLAELVVLVLANAVTTLLRFVVLRRVMRGPKPGPGRGPGRDRFGRGRPPASRLGRGGSGTGRAHAAASPLGATVTDHAELPLPDYDHLPTGSLEGRIRGLTADQLATVRDYEATHGNRLDVLQVLDARAAQLEAGAEPTSGSPDAARPEAAGSPEAPPQASPQTSGPPINPPSHGDPTNPAQPRS